MRRAGPTKAALIDKALRIFDKCLYSSENSNIIYISQTIIAK